MKRTILTAGLVTLLSTAAADVPPPRARGIAMTADEPGFVFRLSEGTPQTERPKAIARPPAEPLEGEALERVLARLPPLAGTEEDEKPFALREGSLPPPRTGALVKTAFPPAEAPKAQDRPTAGPLEVRRRAPEGEVPLAPSLSLTFSQPMVALAAVEALEKEPPPATISPEPAGRWRWVGTETLLFQPEIRFPMATDYRVRVPAGTSSAVGGRLASAVTWTFSTPAPRLVTKHPDSGPARPDAVLFAAFDQRIDPDAVLATIRLSASGAPRTLRRATPQELEADERLRTLVKLTEAGRWLAFRPVERLPADAPVTVTVGPGTPSAEGPKKTAAAQTWTYRTFGPLRVTGHRCGWNNECPPGTPWRIDFSNPLDPRAFRKDLVRVEPSLPSLQAFAQGSSLTLHGASRGHTTYRVSLGALQDVFGQALEGGPPLSFAVGAAPPNLFASANTLAVLDPKAPPRFPVYSTNHETLRVQLLAVRPEDWGAWLAYVRSADGEKPGAPPGRSVVSTVVKVAGTPDELVETPIDLSPALANGHGHAILVVEPTKPAKERWQRRAVRVWVQATEIGLDAFADHDSVLAWATSLLDGRPLEGVPLQLLPSQASVSTGGDGLATLPLTDRAQAILVARRGDDVAFLPENLYYWNENAGWRRRPLIDATTFYVFDDRHLYRPGETAKLKGWIRVVGAGPQGDLRPTAVSSVGYVLVDSHGNEIAKGDAPLNASGGFELSLALPPTMNLGSAGLALTAGKFAHRHVFEVQEFRRPEFEVEAAASEGPHFVGGVATVTATAAYYAGGALPGSPLSWRVEATRATFIPPNRDDWTFGDWVPWWRPWPAEGPSHVEELTAQTDAAGRHVLRIDFETSDPPRPHQVRAEATVTDVNRQAIAASATLLVHSGALYVGLKSERLFVQQGQPLRVQAIVVDLDGHAVAGRAIAVRAERLAWEQVDGEWKETAVDPRDCPLVSAEEGSPCTFPTTEGGQYRITARVLDDQQRPNESRLQLWVAGGKGAPRRGVEQEAVTLVPEKKDYRPGETARFLVLAPFSPAEGLLTLEREGRLRHERFHVSGASHTIEVPIEEAFTPNVHLQVDLVGKAPRTREDGEPDPKLPPRPAFASGQIELKVPPRARTLGLAVTPREKALAPGGATTLDVRVKDAAGAPVAGSDVAVVVVDEAVLALTGYRLPDPLGVFYAPRAAGVDGRHLRASVLLGRPTEADRAIALGGAGGVMQESLALPAAAPAPLRMAMAKSRAEEKAPEPIRTRTDFAALALFAGSLPTDAEGRARVDVKLPDSLTRYRVMAVAAAGATQFGSGESTITARLPLMVRPSPPRFLNFGDRFELPVVVQNQTEAPLVVDVAVRARNAELVAGAGRRLTVPANDRAEVRFPSAAARAGRARFQLAAASGALADAAEVGLPVWTPATTEAFAVYGHLDQGAMVQPIRAPKGVLPSFGGLEVTTSSTAVQALTDAVLYLVAYPFECAEQLSSRVLGVAALRDVLTAFQAEGLPRPDEMAKAVDRDLERLRAMQNDDGGFGFWRRGEPSWPYVSLHVAHALARAKAKGFAVPDPVLERSKKYLKDIEKHVPPDYPIEVRRTLVAYALDVRQRLGDADPGRARALLREAGVEKLPLEALGFLLGVLHRDPDSRPETQLVLRHLRNRVAETAAAAHFVTSYQDGGHLLLDSDRRADAVILEALIGADPASDLIPKLVEGLLAHRTAGRWSNTQENAFVLLALDRYFGAYEKTTPDFVARVWLGESYAGEHAYRGRTTERQELEVPMSRLVSAPSADLLLAREGKGRLYYRLGLRYAPESLVLESRDQGFTVERRYEGADAAADVRRDADGTWRVRAGTRVRVKLTMVATARRYHVALVDPLPAGLEALNPALATTGSLPAGPPDAVTLVGAPGLGGPRWPGSWWFWTRPWYEHQNLRDERVEAFASLVWDGVWEYAYVARATTPGSFVVPPPKAEEMYHPETFGRGRTDRLVVE
jgi:uncharacterized protein YfaS (alpha-2-macroglobulin family)